MSSRPAGRRPGGPRRPVKDPKAGAKTARKRGLRSPGARPSDLLRGSRFAAVKSGKFTGRAALLVVVLAVLSLSYASSMKAYLAQRAHLNELRADIAAHEESIAELERQRERWDDPEFVKAQARARFGYVMPGEVSLVVIDADGNPLDPEAELTDPDTRFATEPTAWWDRLWGSVETAGHPPAVEEPPVERITVTP